MRITRICVISSLVGFAAGARAQSIAPPCLPTFGPTDMGLQPGAVGGSQSMSCIPGTLPSTSVPPPVTVPPPVQPSTTPALPGAMPTQPGALPAQPNTPAGVQVGPNPNPTVGGVPTTSPH